MSIFGPKICIFLRYAHITPIFWGQMDPNQWDHKSPISWGNSGYLRYSGIWPFGRSAGRFLAPIAQNSPFWVKKWCFLARNQFLWTSSIFLVPSWRDTKKTTFSCWSCCWTSSWGGSRAIFGPKLALKAVFLRYTHITPIFGGQTDPAQWDHNFPTSWGDSG